MLDKNNDIITKLVNLNIEFDTTLNLFNLLLEKNLNEHNLNQKNCFQENKNNNININYMVKGNSKIFNNLDLKNKFINYYNSYSIDNCININLNKSYIKKHPYNFVNNSNIINNIETEKINNESQNMKVKKNHKFVFINKKLIKQKSKKRELKDGKMKRRSIFRGVSKNGSKWQTIIYCKNNKGYIGTYPSEEIAARVYDIVSIKKKGIKAKTNFIYNIRQINKIIESNIDLKSKRINNIILDLIR